MDCGEVMSIEMENPKTALEKADALTNLIQQMAIAHRMKDESKFNEVYKRAGEIGFDLVHMLEE